MIDNVKMEEIKRIERFAKASFTKNDINNEIVRCQSHIQQLLKRISKVSEEFPAECPENDLYPLRENIGWTEGFWSGIIWLLFEETQKDYYKKLAYDIDQSFIERIQKQIVTDHHDLGFLFSLSTVAEYKLTGSALAKEASITAAETLLNRYWQKAGVIQAWGSANEPSQQGRMIMDCCMNLPLLYWASEETGDMKFSEAASNHIKNAADYLVREDASTYHTFYMDVETGQPKYGSTHQGFNDDSCWARGQAWGVYGFALSYRYLKDPKYFELSKKLANYFINRLPEDLICYWDLDFVEGNQERDTSSMAILVCGLLELLEYDLFNSQERQLYSRIVSSIMLSLKQNYSTKAEADGFLTQSVYNMPKGNGVNTPSIWGDYYYLEALIRMKGHWLSLW
ncbi:glycoside hydrolase family 88 protein [Enterococcus sp.]|jgi:unsaturated chondroitin disaccharide hydrolase|uniref:glycoside hydrolase family 88 protein n=1 Tax=Enterococcus sp. TaxID=35783 RepID=UPI0025C1C059|nr:glycoside hydrolase family 88 protein [Enterococcus sp.]